LITNYCVATTSISGYLCEEGKIFVVARCLDLWWSPK